MATKKEIEKQAREARAASRAAKYAAAQARMAERNREYDARTILHSEIVLRPIEDLPSAVLLSQARLDGAMPHIAWTNYLRHNHTNHDVM